jgi:hypothetical protein
MIIVGVSAFCSDAHRQEHGNKTTKASAARTQKKNRSDGLTNEARERVLALDNFKCRYCGGTDNLAVHHIYYRSEAKGEVWLHEDINLITLCNYPCHIDIVHGNKKLYQPICSRLAQRLSDDDGRTIKAILQESQ